MEVYSSMINIADLSEQLASFEGPVYWMKITDIGTLARQNRK